MYKSGLKKGIVNNDGIYFSKFKGKYMYNKE